GPQFESGHPDTRGGDTVSPAPSPSHASAEPSPAEAIVARVPIRAVVFDVDFTLAKPGPDLGPEGYQRLGARYGLALDPARYDDARRHAVDTLERHPELDHDEEVWVVFTEQIIRGMGGDSDRSYECPVEMTRAW